MSARRRGTVRTVIGGSAIRERPIEEVREIRDEIEQRVIALFDELLSETPSAE